MSECECNVDHDKFLTEIVRQKWCCNCVSLCAWGTIVSHNDENELFVLFLSLATASILTKYWAKTKKCLQLLVFIFFSRYYYGWECVVTFIVLFLFLFCLQRFNVNLQEKIKTTKEMKAEKRKSMGKFAVFVFLGRPKNYNCYYNCAIHMYLIVKWMERTDILNNFNGIHCEKAREKKSFIFNSIWLNKNKSKRKL